MNTNTPECAMLSFMKDPTSISGCISAQINEHYIHSDPIKQRRQSALSLDLFYSSD